MEFIHLDTIDSTNRYLKNKSSVLNDFSVVYADYQNNGHGRFSRVWESERNKNLLCSILLKDYRAFKHISSLSLLTGVAVFKLLQSLNINNAKIKWPNDIYVNDKKICGILLESVSLDNDITSVVIGIGLNINQTKFSEPSITSLSSETSLSYEIKNILNKLIHIFKKELHYLYHNKNNYIDVINSNNYLLNKKMLATIENKQEEVVVKDINKDNSINVILNNKTISLISNELSFVNRK